MSTIQRRITARLDEESARHLEALKNSHGEQNVTALLKLALARAVEAPAAAAKVALSEETDPDMETPARTDPEPVANPDTPAETDTGPGAQVAATAAASLDRSSVPQIDDGCDYGAEAFHTDAVMPRVLGSPWRHASRRLTGRSVMPYNAGDLPGHP